MLLSVIIPVYNVEKYIRECFDSIVAQKFDDIEFICVDDGSSDSSGVICDEYAKKDNRFIVRHTVNKGVATARNLGLSLASGEYIAWIDPDDYVSANWGEVISCAINNNEWDILVFDYTILNNGIRTSKKYKEKTGFIDKFEFLSDIVDDQVIQSQLWQKVFKRKCLSNVVFPENVKCMEDYAVLHKIIEKIDKIFYLNQSLYNYRVRNDGLVMEVDLQKSLNCYLIAKERYEYLIAKYKNISRIGFLCQALGFCIQFHKASRSSKYYFSKEYGCLKDIIKKHIFYILKNTGLSYKNKIKFLLVVFDIVGVCIMLKDLRGIKD